MAPSRSADALPYFAASGISAFLGFPLWKAAAISQSGYEMTAASPMKRYLQALRPPWRGCFNVVAGMTWARASIFFGSDRGRQWLQRSGYNPWVASTLPPALISAFVQVVNQPFTRASVTLQNPACGTCRSAWLPSLLILQQLVEARGVAALWHGMSPAILKTVPKYVTAVTARDMLENQLPPAGSSEASLLLRSATKSVMAALAGAALTNPCDVLRNEMFKSDERLSTAARRLWRDEGACWLWRGCGKNLAAVAMPIASTIFLTDVFVSLQLSFDAVPGGLLPARGASGAALCRA
ncbi:unnamed protein product [Polarella glacialis]|uniref:Mitochondrial carrier protein n=1 Tax=Polarella glacialis TaxID=89957 RepID=A0A813JZ27_POLGL|nr:unnamed protein product [Polarella glacialis]